MAKAVRSISSFSAASGTRIRSTSSRSSTAGKSLPGRVASVKRLRPACTVTFSPDWLIVTRLPSGRARTISNSLRAGIVVSPSWASSTSVRATISTSRSVPVMDRRPPSTLTSRLASTGSVWRRSTTLTTCCRGLRRTSRVRLKRMRIPKLLGWIYQNVVAVEPAKTPDNTCNTMFLFNFLAPLSLWVRLRTARDKLWTKSGTGFHPQLVHNPSPVSPGTSFAQLAQQLVPVLTQLAVGFPQFADHLAGVHDGGVIAPPERIADFRQAVLCQFLGQGHRHLSRTGQGTGPPLGQQVCHAQLVVVCHGLLDVAYGDGLLLRPQQVAQGLQGEVGVDGPGHEVGARRQGIERTL